MNILKRKGLKNFGIMKMIGDAVEEAFIEGKTCAQFQKDLKPKLIKAKWWSNKVKIDDATGKETLEPLKSLPWLDSIYYTGISALYAAERWKDFQRCKKTRPYLRCSAVEDRKSSPYCLSHHGIIRPIDDKFWENHLPPHHTGCRCGLTSLSDRDLERKEWTITAEDDLPKW